MSDAPGVAIGKQIADILLRAQAIESRSRQITAEAEALVSEVQELSTQFVLFATDSETTLATKKHRARTAAQVMAEEIEKHRIPPEPVEFEPEEGEWDHQEPEDDEPLEVTIGVDKDGEPEPEAFVPFDRPAPKPPERKKPTAAQSRSKSSKPKPAPTPQGDSTTSVSVPAAKNPDKKWPCRDCGTVFLSKARRDRHEKSC